jgi:hypothetical protein
VSYAVITLCVASQRVFVVVVYFVIDSVRKILDTPSYYRGLDFGFERLGYETNLGMCSNMS